ncbi:class I SAM-dependent methyltransferase [Undibacterium sp. Ji49W]|uniref:class I SAM-dependent methyltransferase n=1 Tax=Undibacterium sp. Ji49W TaxID=3413040 RepID=UPI003BF281E0
MKKLKSDLIKLIWSLGLRGVADKLHFRYLNKKFEEENAAFVKKYPEFQLPPPELIFDANHNVNWETYRSSGMTDAQKIADLIERYVDGPDAAVFEWGCGPARIIRHLGAKLTRFQKVELTGSDYNAASIQWCNAKLPGIHFLENRLSPPIALNDQQFNFIYAISIFTHLSEKSIHEWLAEMHRLLKDQGYFAFTTHGEKFTFCLSPEQMESFRQGNLVTRDGDIEGKKLFGSFHPKQWVESVVHQIGYKVIHFSPEGFHRQDLWIVQKTDAQVAVE